jgi:catechol 2,3-dioxygenase-like lactoylglutathione lyase family enzyme
MSPKEAAPRPTAGHPPLEGLHEAALYTSDLERAERFWRGLGLPFIARNEGRHVFFRAGDDLLLVFDPSATENSAAGFPPHGARGQGHVALSVADHAMLERWREHLAAAGVPIEAGVEWPSGGRSIYFRDPDGNSIELITRGSWGF